jgi:hypothetical protein
MSTAPGIGPQLSAEERFALEVTRRMAYGAPRESLAWLMQRLHQDNMVLRKALLEMIGEDQSQFEP